MDHTCMQRRGPFLTFLILSCWIQTIHSAPLSSYLVSSFTSPDPSLPFNHITINNITGDVYIGARERLYQLSSDLTLKNTVDTGSCTDVIDSTNNDNSLLLVAPSPADRLITCGGCDAYCETRSLTNISHDVQRHDSYDIDNNVVTGSTQNDPVVNAVGAVVLGADFVRNGKGTLDGNLYLFTGIGSKNAPFFSKHRLGDLHRVQSITSSDSGRDENLFRHVLAYTDYLFYFINRGNKVYLGRLCRNSRDLMLSSYTEIELQCGSHDMIQSAHIGPAGSRLADSLNIISTDDLLYGIFSKGMLSALCVYPMTVIQQRFEDAVLGCIHGTSDGAENMYLWNSMCLNVPNFDPPQSYQCTAFSIRDYTTLYQYAIGNMAISSSPILTIPNVTATSIVTVIERHHTVAFIGDSQGNLNKGNLINSSFGYIYEKIMLGGGSILQKMFLAETDEQMTVATSSEEGSKVLILELVNCGGYQSCGECIGENGGNDGDPYCGWCTLEARCTRYSECPFPDDSTRWLPYDALQCVSISNINPDHRMPYQQTEQEIIITVEQLPDLNDTYQYQCAFDSYVVSAATTDNTITCETPPTNELPAIPDGMDHVKLGLSIVSTETNVNFVTTDFILFDCSYFKSCTSCVSSLWSCDWCVYDNICTHDSNLCQSGDTVVIGSNSITGSGNRGSGFCSQLIGTSQPFFIPVNIASGYSLLAENLPTDESKIRFFECILSIDGVEIRVPTTFRNDTYIVCRDEQYIYSDDVLLKNVTVSVQWNGQNNIDDPSETHVTLYKCSVNSGSCSRCLSEEASPSNLKCGWCGDDCNVMQSDICQQNQFLSQNETQLCSAPIITEFYPLSASINGQTRLEIGGTDLGVAFGDVLQVLIGEIECDLSDMGSFYQPGQSVSCMTGISTESRSGRVKITVRFGQGTRTGESTEDFHYRDPMILGFTPTEGQAAGGTSTNITGMFLNTGRNITARFGEATCNDLNIQDTVATCKTSSISMNEQIPTSLTMSFDEVEKTFQDYTFTYQPNPIIDDIDWTRSIMSGGLSISLTGERFHLIREPKIVVSSLTTNASNFQLCNGTATLLICPTPSFPDDVISSRRRKATDDAMIARLSFDLDGYILDGGTIEYYTDPMYEIFPGPNRIYESDNQRLNIEGIGLDLASTEDDVQVLLGPDGICDVDILKDNMLGCQVPDSRPLAGYLNGTRGEGAARNLPAVIVLHGNLMFHPGFVSAWAIEENALLATIIPVVIVVLIVVSIPMVAVACWFRKKQRQLQRAKEEVEMVRTNILNRVREVGKTNVDVSGADGRVQEHGIPFRGHVHYVTMMLFGGLGHHPETSDPEYMEEFMEHSVVAFYRMLKKKDMLTDYIRQLESKKEGCGRERELIASLLALTLVSEGKSIHFTEVLVSLVEDEIRRASKSRGGINTLFTKTETIATKLINNWFALFMFEYLKVYALYPMFMLYQAIKTQAEKGPVDVGSGEAYYTLEFDKLFDQTVEFHSLKLEVVDEDGQVYLNVNVLDVDTIQQAKQKILDSMWMECFCLLPRDIDVVDLVWIQSPDKAIVLKDTDEISETHDKAVLNTMKSYGITDRSRVALIPKQQGDGYQALEMKDLASNAYESLQNVDMESIAEPLPSLKGSHPIHLKDEEHLSRMGSSMPDHIKQQRANLDRNLAIPHMLTMKASISPYVDGIFEVMFKTPSKLPLPVKHLFDTFDELAVKYAGGGSPEAYAEKWKKNCLCTFWGSLLTNLPSLFEMPRSDTADRSTVVLAEALEHAAKTISLRQEDSEHLPYYTEHQLQRRMVTDYCTQITSLPKVRPGKLNRACSSVSKEFKGHFSHQSSMLHLYNLTKNDVGNLLE